VTIVSLDCIVKHRGDVEWAAQTCPFMCQRSVWQSTAFCSELWFVGSVLIWTISARACARRDISPWGSFGSGPLSFRWFSFQDRVGGQLSCARNMAARSRDSY